MSAVRLGWFRAILFASLAIDAMFVTPPTSVWVQLPAWAWTPVSFYAWFPTQDGPADSAFLVDLLWWVALVAAAVGFKTRIATISACVIGWLVMGLPLNYSFFHHHHHLAALILPIMALAPCGARFSVDALLARRHGRPEWTPRPDPAWAFDLLSIVIASIYFGGGVMKAGVSGLGYLDSVWVKVWWAHAELDVGYGPSLLSRLLTAPPPEILVKIGTIGAVALEIAGLLLMHERLRRPVAIALIGLHVGIGVLGNLWYLLNAIILTSMILAPRKALTAQV